MRGFVMLKFISGIVLVFSVLMTGCASVPTAPKEEDAAKKTFAAPASDKAGLYIYRNSFVGQALKKTVYVDGTQIGESSNKVFFYKELSPGEHKVSTESEFGENDLKLNVEGGKNYFVEQYIKMGAFVGGAGLKLVDEKEGKENVLKCKLAK
jgi:Protein of unknown function (DUF2846)